MNQNANSPLSRNFVTRKPGSHSHAIEEALRQGAPGGKFQRFSEKRHDHSRFYGGYEFEPKPQPNKDVSTTTIAGLQGSKLSVARNTAESKRSKVTLKDRATGLPRECFIRVEMRSITVLCRGTAFTFSCKAGSKTALDSRSGERKPLHFVKAELRRLLGFTVGDAHFAEFVTATR